MKKKRILLNKYTVAVFILLAYFATDVLLHKGMARVLLPASFTDKRLPADFLKCNSSISIGEKRWVKAVNTVERMQQMPAATAGIEMDVYFDTLKNCLLVYHDSAAYSTLNIEAVLGVYKTRNLKASIWLDFKNLSIANEQQALNYIVAVKNRFGLASKIIVESSHPECLQSFCDSGFYTSYYTPFFNPYLESEAEIITTIDSIAINLKRYPVSAVSGYYFQYPLLKKFFPGVPILTWSDNSRASVVSYCCNRKLANDSQVKVVLYPNP